MPVNIGPKIGIDGEAEFRKELNNIIQQCRTLDSEMKAVTSAFDDNDNSQEKLARQSEVLAKQIQAQTQRVEMLKKGLSESTKEYGEADTKTLKWAQAVNEANTLLNRMSNELETLNTSDFESEMRDAADATEDMNDSLLSMGDIVGGNLIADGLGRLVDSLSAAVEETKEYRKIMASLEVSSEQAGYSASQTAETYKQLYGVLADDQTAATTTANLQALGLTQSDLNTITDATIGAWARYGDSIPIDSLSEAINETIKTGTVNAIRDNESLAKRVTKELADAATNTIQDINTSQWRSSGYYAAIGFANGIRSGRSEVISAANAVAQAAIIAAENTLEIGSPSKVFKEIGAFTSEGFAIGFDIDGLKKQIASALDFQQRNISNITAAQMKYDPVSRAIKSVPAGNVEVHIVVNAAEGQDENEIANRVMYKIQHAVSQKKAVWGT